MTPDFRITADGEDVTAVIQDRLLSLTVTDEDGTKSDALELVLDDRDGRIAFPEVTATLDVALGVQGAALHPVGRYLIDGVSGEGPVQQMTITAKAVDMKSGIRAPRTRAWEDVTLGDIVGKVAAEAGLKPVIGASVAGTHWPYIAQTAESDLHLLTRLAATVDATAKATTGTLVVQKRGEGKTADGQMMTAVALPLWRFASWSWKLDGRAPSGTVEAQWQDTAGGALTLVTRGSACATCSAARPRRSARPRPGCPAPPAVPSRSRPGLRGSSRGSSPGG